MGCRTHYWIAAASALMLGAAGFALSASADDLVVYDIDPASGPAAIASGSFTFDQTADTITSWDIKVVDGSSTITFRNGGLQSSSYSLGALVWDARFSLGNGSGTLLELFFANPGLGAITGGPATVPLLARSTEIVGGVGAQIDNHSVSAVAEPGTFALMLAGIGLVGRTLRRRVTHFAPAVAT